MTSSVTVTSWAEPDTAATGEVLLAEGIAAAETAGEYAAALDTAATGDEDSEVVIA